MTNPMPPPHIGRVSLAVTDLERSVRFYSDVIGLTLLARAGDEAVMGAGDVPLLLLHGQPGLSRVRRTTGLYHFALLLPSRADLGDALAHYAKVDAPLAGFADHAVSEAIYLTDPDGHGIEVYRDRPRDEWAYPAGTLRMTTEQLDFDGVLAARGGTWRGLPPGTMMGHIHLQVANIAATERFYIDQIGFDLIIRYGPSATFLAANGYHHHIGANTWAGAGLPPAPPDAARLLWYEIRQPDAAAVETIAARLAAAEHPFAREANGVRVSDPSGIEMLLTS
jgi:catechol 2,3-dioxygenase